MNNRAELARPVPRPSSKAILVTQQIPNTGKIKLPLFPKLSPQSQLWGNQGFQTTFFQRGILGRSGPGLGRTILAMPTWAPKTGASEPSEVRPCPHKDRSLGQTEAAGVEEETPKGLGQHLLPTRREALHYLITKHPTGLSVLPPYLP